MTARGIHQQVAAWVSRRPAVDGGLAADARRLGVWSAEAADFLPLLAASGPEPAAARHVYRQGVGAASAPFVRAHLDRIAGRLAEAPERSLGAVDLVVEELLPALLPTAAELAADAARPLEAKVGFEYKSAVVLGELLASPRTGEILLDLGRQETSRAAGELARFSADDEIDLGSARMRRDGPLAAIEITRPHRLNAENDALLDDLETCVDVALLDPRVEVVSLRGGPVASEKYAGRRVFCSGIDLTEIYQGRLACAYYVRRELGLVSKIFRGLAARDGRPEIEKPFVAVVDGHAIGGGLQMLLVVDHVIADERATLRLPARREGIIPGAANLRLPRALGERAARRAILLDADIAAASSEGAMLVDQVLPEPRMDAAVAAVTSALASSGLVSLAANRKALRLGLEPLEVFRTYMAHFAIAQADCHFSAALVDNLRRHWIGRKRAEPGG